MTPSTRGLAEEVIEADEAEVTAAFIAFLEAASTTPPSVGADPAVQPGARRRLCRGRVRRPCRSAGRAARGPVRGACLLSRVHQVCERLVRHRPGEGRPGDVDLDCRRPR